MSLISRKVKKLKSVFFKNFDNNKNIKTTIIVSHRFETLKMYNKAYFIENGKVEELKNFEELTSKYKVD